jgi:hypothetical protein
MGCHRLPKIALGEGVKIMKIEKLPKAAAGERGGGLR